MSEWAKAMTGRRYWSPARHVAQVEDVLGTRAPGDLPHEAQAEWLRALRLARVADWQVHHGRDHEDAGDLMQEALSRFESVSECYADPLAELRGWR